LKGEVVKSFEECVIANFLHAHGIAYKYEHPYELDTSGPVYRQYKGLFTPTRVTQTLDFEVYGGQLGYRYTWANAKKACEALGDGWRPPTRSEMLLLSLIRGDLGGIGHGAFWTSEERDDAFAYALTFSIYSSCLGPKLKEREYLYVVPVRDAQYTQANNKSKEGV